MQSSKHLVRRIGFFLFSSIIISFNHAQGQGFIIPKPVPNRQMPVPALTEHKVDVDITDQIARVKVHQVFTNRTHWTLEGIYYFPLPQDASVSDFEMIVDGKVLSGELLEKDKARRIYEEIVRRQIDPALLEYVDHNLFGASIFPIPPGEKRTIVLEYTSLLKLDGDLVCFVYPLRGRPGQGRTVRSRSIPHPPEPFPALRENEFFEMENDVEENITQLIHLNLSSGISLKTIYSPSHDVDINRENDHQAQISYEGKRKNTSESFVLYYSFSQKEFGMNSLTYKPEKKDMGFFMLLISPKTEYSEKDIIGKDILFILDTSGSMKGEKIRQAKESLQYCIRNLNSGDRFNLITFSTETRSFSSQWAPSTDRQDAYRFIDNIEAKGGTNINDALLEALRMKTESNRPVLIIFMTDGLPTVGEQNSGTIIQNVKDSNVNRIRIFTFGLGYDVNTLLLDRIAEDSHSVSDYIEPEENIEETISNFYDKINYPVLTDLTLEYQGIRTEDVYPKQLPDLFKGTQLTVMGRYQENSQVEILLKGKVNGKERKFSYQTNFAGDSEANAFLPHLWATRRIGFLMDEIRLHGENSELKDEIIRLSKTYGVMSPYTSYLVQEDDLLVDHSVPMTYSPQTGNATRGSGSKKLKPFTAGAPMEKGFDAVQMSKTSREMKETEAVKNKEYMKQIGMRLFILKDGIWTDSEFQSENTVDIQYGSQAYLDIILTYPDIAKYCSLGERVIFKYKNKYIRISGSGKETWSENELKCLLK